MRGKAQLVPCLCCFSPAWLAETSAGCARVATRRLRLRPRDVPIWPATSAFASGQSKTSPWREAFSDRQSQLSCSRPGNCRPAVFTRRTPCVSGGTACGSHHKPTAAECPVWCVVRTWSSLCSSSSPHITSNRGSRDFCGAATSRTLSAKTGAPVLQRSLLPVLPRTRAQVACPGRHDDRRWQPTQARLTLRDDFTTSR